MYVIYIFIQKGVVAAVKYFTGGPLCTEEERENNIAQIYSDVRLELNKLILLDHPNIIKCIGFCVSSLSFAMEWAPLGSIKVLLESYKSTGYCLCPESLIITMEQVLMSYYRYIHIRCLIHPFCNTTGISSISIPSY